MQLIQTAVVMKVLKECQENVKKMVIRLLSYWVMELIPGTGNWELVIGYLVIRSQKGSRYGNEPWTRSEHPSLQG